MEGPKSKIARRFLALLQRYVSLEDAQVATLGGKGLEAKLWLEVGIPTAHGSLIEINRARSKALIAGYHYQVHNRLSTFAQSWRSSGKTHIDAFHLDLCGTMRPSVVKEFDPIFGLVLGGVGRCIAITVADARKNPALDNWPLFEKMGLSIFGFAMHDVLGRLEQQQRLLPIRTDLPKFMSRFDPSKASRREFAVMLSLANLLQRYTRWSPEIIERYIYVSREFEPHPFRMRTYMFRFEEVPFQAQMFAEQWLQSPLYNFSDPKFIDVTRTSTDQPKEEKGTTMSRLQSVIISMRDPELIQEYDSLVASRRDLHDLVRIMQNVLQQLPEKQEVQSSESPAPETAPLKVSATDRSIKNWDDMSECQKIDWLIRYREYKAGMGDAWNNGHFTNLLKKDFGKYTPKLGHKIRAASAHMSGKFRASFVSRIREAFGERAQSYVDRLDRLQS